MPVFGEGSEKNVRCLWKSTDHSSLVGSLVVRALVVGLCGGGVEMLWICRNFPGRGTFHVSWEKLERGGWTDEEDGKERGEGEVAGKTPEEARCPIGVDILVSIWFG